MSPDAFGETVSQQPSAVRRNQYVLGAVTNPSGDTLAMSLLADPPPSVEPDYNGRLRGMSPDDSDRGVLPGLFEQQGTGNLNAKVATHRPILSVGRQESTKLSRTYFSEDNQRIVQNAIRKKVHDLTGEVIAEQDRDQLIIVMRSMYLQYSSNQSESSAVIREQITFINAKVVEYCAPTIVSSMLQYKKYREDISTLPMPMEYGTYTSQTGTKVTRTLI